jgi:hypothetical protein
MQTLYHGKTRFEREQIVFVVECILVAALDRISDGLPDCIDYADRVAAVNGYHTDAKNLLSYEEGALESAGMALGAFYAQLTGDGLGIGDALACADHVDDACRKLVAAAWADEGLAVRQRLVQLHGHTFHRTDLYPDFPNSRRHAERFVEATFGQSYFLEESVTSTQQNDLTEARTKAADGVFEAYDFGEDIVLDHDGWSIDYDELQKVVYFENPKGGDSIARTFYVKFAPTGIMPINFGTM